MNLLVSIFVLAAMRPTESKRTVEQVQDTITTESSSVAALDEIRVNSSKKAECECPAGLPMCSHVEPCITKCSERMTEPCKWKAMCTVTLFNGRMCDCSNCPGTTKVHQAYIDECLNIPGRCRDQPGKRCHWNGCVYNDDGSASCRNYAGGAECL